MILHRVLPYPPGRTLLVMRARTGAEGVHDLDELLAAAGVRTIAVDTAQAYLARDAFTRYGKGRSAAGLSFGDCFSYALAQATEEPLLFKGGDFSQTDVTPAVASRPS